MGTLVETSIIIEAERAGLRPLAFVQDDEVAIAAITASELLHGVHRADPVHRARRTAFVEEVLATARTVPFDLEIARRHAQLWAELETSGSRIGPHDLQIAATALVLGWPVATLNVREFERVPGLTLVPLPQA